MGVGEGAAAREDLLPGPQGPLGGGAAIGSIDRIPFRSGSSPTSSRIFSTYLPEVMAKREAECLMRKAISLFSLILTDTGTLTPPAKKIPNSAAVHEFLPSASSVTRSPRASPRDSRNPATCRASSTMPRKLAPTHPAGWRSFI